MSFTNQEWLLKDLKELNDFILLNKRTDKDIMFERNIVNTKLDCYAIKSEVINSIVKEIVNGNASSFLNIVELNNYPISIIYGKVLINLESFDEFKKFFNKYITVIDSWAHCDIFKLKVKKLGKDNVVSFINECLQSKNLFVRRISVIILLKNFLTNKQDLKYSFKCVNLLAGEKEYYVNMAIAWLLCECFIKHRSETLTYLQTNNVNEFVLNKCVSKCCDSFRVSSNDKKILKELLKN